MLALLFAVTPIFTLSVGGESEKGVVIVAFGDSIAAAGSWEKYFQNLSGESVINAGVGGENSGDGLRRFTNSVANRKPDVVFIGFGTNDAAIDMAKHLPLDTYTENIRTTVDKVRALGALPIIITPPPIVDAPYFTRHEKEPFEIYGGANGLVSLYAQAARNVAVEKEVVVADINVVFGERNFASLISDGIHPNDAGYRLYAEVALDAYRRATRGDINLDNQITAVDYIMAKRAVLGTYTLSPAQIPRADVNGDGATNTVDYIMIKRNVIGTYTIDRGILSSSH